MLMILGTIRLFCMVFAYFGGLMEDIRYDGNMDLSIQNVGFVSVLRNQNYTFEYKNGKERYSFIYVTSGKMEYYFYREHQKYTINSGEFLYIPKGIPYKSTYLENDTVIKIIVFDISCAKLLDYLKTPFIRDSIEIKNVFDTIAKTNMYDELYLTAKIYEILFCIKKENAVISKQHKKILPAVTEIKMKYYENKKISYYSDLCNMSESNFRKLFKEYTGRSVIEYRNALRIAQVNKMLDSGEFSVSEAAYAAGFHNMSFFYEVYNKERILKG